MRTFASDERGVMTLVTVLLLPLVLVVLVGVLELGRVRVVAERARIAADLATVTAANDQDDAELARSGALRITTEAEGVARDLFALNIAPLTASLAIPPGDVAARADIAVFAGRGGVDPRTGATYATPTVRLAAQLPILTPAFATLLARPVTVIDIFSASSAR